MIKRRFEQNPARAAAATTRLSARVVGFVALVAASVVPNSSLAADFAVLSYNVRGLPPEGSVVDRTAQIAQIASLLEDFHTPATPYAGIPSLVAIQEAFYGPYFTTLTDPATVNFPDIPDKDSGGPTSIGDGLSILSDFKLDPFSRRPWDDCFGTMGEDGSDCDTNKGFTLATVAFDELVSVDVYTLHADAGQDERSREARRGNLRQLITAINSETPEERAVIVLGDFNSRYTRFDDDVAQEVLSAVGLKDVWVQLRRGGIVPSAGPDINADCATNPATGNCELVNKVLYRSGKSVVLIPKTYNVLKSMFSDDSDNDLSDRYPVAVKFSYLAPTQTTTTTSSTSTSTSTLLIPLLCGDATGDDSVKATDALAVLKAAVGGNQCDGVKKLCVCDVNASGTVTASDALAVLKAAVGQALVLRCVC